MDDEEVRGHVDELPEETLNRVLSENPIVFLLEQVEPGKAARRLSSEIA